MSPRYQLDLLGGCQLRDGQTGNEVTSKSRKSRCLLGLLALWPGGRMSREKLASFLWDPAPDEQARTSLRQAIKEIRDCLGEDADLVLDSQRLDIGLKRESVGVDVTQLLSGLAAASKDPQAALDLATMWKGELFGDMVPQAPIFEAWVQVERARLRDVLSVLLTDHLQAMINAKDFAKPELAEALVRIEPSHELAYQFLMRCHASRGDQAGALRQYARLTNVLDVELDSEPSQESIDLLVAIKRGDSFAKPHAPVEATSVASAISESQGVPRIAIRPPLTRYADVSKDYLADGFSGLLKVCLSRFRCWIVLSWPNQGFDSKVKIDYPSLGAAIGADYVVDTVLDWRQPGGKLFVSLIDCRDGSQIWTDIYNVAEPELQAMSNTVAGSISSKLASRINYMSSLRFARTSHSDAAAYDLWLRGHQLSRNWTREDDEKAKELFAQAVGRDPGLACAYASLASVLSTQGMMRPGYAQIDQDRKQALELSQKAVSLDPFDSRNHINMGWSWLLANSVGRAFSHFSLAAELNPHDSETLIASAMGMGFMGHTEKSLEWSATAISLNPVHPEYFLGYLGSIRYLAGDFKTAAQIFERCPDAFPDRKAWAAAAHARLGEKEKSIEYYEDFREQVSRIWEGASPLTREELHHWMLFQSNPVVWKAGRASLKEGLELACTAFEKRSHE
jgi:DNA-binding SARP family transcriptional activator/Tfp pilus assembly protein PilF